MVELFLVAVVNTRSIVHWLQLVMHFLPLAILLWFLWRLMGGAGDWGLGMFEPLSILFCLLCSSLLTEYGITDMSAVILVIIPYHILWVQSLVCTTEIMLRYTFMKLYLFISHVIYMFFPSGGWICLVVLAGVLLCLESKWWFRVEAAYRIRSWALYRFLIHVIWCNSKSNKWWQNSSPYQP